MDEAPFNAWQARVGQASYDLLREEERDRLRAAGEEQKAERPWRGYPQADPALRTNSVINHLAARLTAQERVRRGWVLPWNRTAPPRQEDEELPQAECGWAPWAY
ncbi:hypothetical protein ACIG3E_11330 [Streptomyces sp. NPDC053474]|uniref:hypothetical protein n=1 Tax=Streptomyces sp. NPDC053474 TaxID=3365704 RepID=UPI0037D8DC66